MNDSKKQPVVSYTGPLASDLANFLSFKRQAGYKYAGTELHYLKAIDLLTIQMPTEGRGLSKEVVETWICKRETEGHKSWLNRVIVMRQLVRYLRAQGLEAHDPSIIIPNRRSDFLPHIYTNSELKHFFTQADLRPAYAYCPNRNTVSSLLFRMLYGCGLRLSEALTLQVQNVDLEKGVLHIANSKFGMDRLVPMAPNLTARCRSFAKKLHSRSMPERFFFPAPDGGKYSRAGVYSMFRQILWEAEIPHTGKGPRIHDFRHTFAVHCLKKWVREGKDLFAVLPVLSVYLGHKGLAGTQDYLRLTAEMFPGIIAATENRFGSVIPVGGGADHESR